MKRLFIINIMLLICHSVFARRISVDDGSGWIEWLESDYMTDLSSPSSFVVYYLSKGAKEYLIEVSIKNATQSYERNRCTWLVYEGCEIRYYAENVTSLFFSPHVRRQDYPITRKCTLKIQKGKKFSDILHNCINVHVYGDGSFALDFENKFEF